MDRAIKAQTRPKFSFSRKAYAGLLMSGNIQLIFQCNLPEVGHQGLDPHVPMAGIGQRHVLDVPVAVAAGHGFAFHRLDATLGQAEGNRPSGETGTGAQPPNLLRLSLIHI